jgi:hypothetical protein
MIEVGDLVVVVYPLMDWSWARYKIGDIGLVLRIMHYKDYSVVRAKLINTGNTETIPLDYVLKLGQTNESRRSGSCE